MRKSLTLTVFYLTLFCCNAFAQTYSQDTARVNRWNDLADESAPSDLDLTLKYADSAFKLSKKINYTLGLGYAMMNRGLGYDYAGDFDKALIFYDSALVLMEKSGNARGRGLVLSNLGILHISIGKYNKATNYLLHCLQLFKKIGYYKGIAATLNNLGLISRREGEYFKAIDYYKQSIEYKEKIGNYKGVLNTYINICSMYIYLEDWSLALEYNVRALALAREQGTKLHLGELYTSQGSILRGLKRNDEALKAFETALELIPDNNSESKAVAFTGIGSILFDGKNYDDAEIYFLKALEQVNLRNEQNYRLEILDALAQNYQAQKNYKEANKYLKEYITLKTELADAAKSQEVKDLEAKYNYFVQKDKIQTLDQKNKKKDAALQKSRSNAILLTAVILFMIAILLFILYMLQRIRKQKAIASKALADREMLLKEIHHRVKNNLQMVSSLLFLQSENINDEMAINALNVSRSRVEAMAIIHQKLYKDANLSGVSSPEYIDHLIDGIFDTMDCDPDDITIRKNISNLHLDIDTTIPIGLILNELITNALKHAFDPDQEPKILEVSLTNEGDHLKLVVADNGKGNPNLKKEHSTGFGSKLIQMFAKKLHADMSIDRASGYRVELLIKKFTLQ